MNWTDGIAYGAVVAAFAYVARAAWLRFARRRAAACGACDACGSGAPGRG